MEEVRLMTIVSDIRHALRLMRATPLVSEPSSC